MLHWDMALAVCNSAMPCNLTKEEEMLKWPVIRALVVRVLVRLIPGLLAGLLGLLLDAQLLDAEVGQALLRVLSGS